MAIVIDASVALAWSFHDERSDYPRGILRRLARELALVPTIWPLEIVNGLLTAQRRGRLTAADVAEIHTGLAELPISLAEVSLERALGPVLSLARTHQLTAYDASYLELAMREGLALATVDRNLRAAAESVGVPLAP